MKQLHELIHTAGSGHSPPTDMECPATTGRLSRCARTNWRTSLASMAYECVGQWGLAPWLRASGIQQSKTTRREEEGEEKEEEEEETAACCACSARWSCISNRRHCVESPSRQCSSTTGTTSGDGTSVCSCAASNECASAAPAEAGTRSGAADAPSMSVRLYASGTGACAPLFADCCCWPDTGAMRTRARCSRGSTTGAAPVCKNRRGKDWAAAGVAANAASVDRATAADAVHPIAAPDCRHRTADRLTTYEARLIGRANGGWDAGSAEQ